MSGYVSVVRCLEQICYEDAENWNTDTQKDARALLNGLTQFQFVICLVTTSHVMAYIKPLSVLLQGRTVHIIEAHCHVDLLMKTMQDVRANVDSFQTKWLGEAKDLAE